MSLKNIEIYIGSRIEHASERAVLQEIIRLLTPHRVPAIVLANVNLEGRQIDIILALNDLTLMIEAKSYSRPIRGSENGAWQVCMASGKWKDIGGNPYLQALSAKNALRDAMRSFAREEILYYPAATVVFVPVIPRGSTVTAGDFKVSIINIGGLPDEIQKRQAGCWGLDQWRSFARAQRLISVSNIDACCDPVLFDAELLIKQYSSEFSKTYAPSIADVISFSCYVKGEERRSDEVVDLICAAGVAHFFKGPSGCGKSLLSTQAALSYLDKGGLPIFLPAKDYQHKLKDVLNQEVALLANCTGADLFNAARRIGRRTLVILDGYNECLNEKRVTLTRSIAALARKYETDLLVTSQVPLERNDLLTLVEIVIPEPNREIKFAIAKGASGGRPISPATEALLDSVTTGLEAALVGMAGLEIGIDSSRYRLFDAFVRKRLNGIATDGIRLLSRVGGWMAERITFSLSVRDLDRLLATEQSPSSLVSQLYRHKLLVQRGDRVSFGHELFLNAFAAESIIRQAAGNTEQILTALSKPRNANRKEMIVGAIDDDGLLLNVLKGARDPEIIKSCIGGACGLFARIWVETQYPDLFNRMEVEISRIHFEITGDEYPYVLVDPHGLTAWSPQDKALINCLPGLVTQGIYLKEALNLAAAMDKRIYEEIARIREAVKTKTIGLRSHIFWTIYVIDSGNAPALTHVFSQLHGRLFDRNKCKRLTEEIQKCMDNTFLLPGQIYLLAILCRWGEKSDPLVARFITWAIHNHWKVAPGHLRQQLVDTARYCWDLEERDRADLIAAVESCLDNRNPLLNSLIFDVLQGLGAFESEEQEQMESISQQIEQLLTGPVDSESCIEAHCIYDAQFDHPHSGAYCQVINHLNKERRKKFLMMAAKGTRDLDLFLAPLLTELASLNDPAAGDIFNNSASLPPRDSIMPQDAISVFVVAHISLARLGCELPQTDFPSDEPAATALLACGAILYWMNRLDIQEAERHNNCNLAWSILNSHADNAALNAIKECAEVRMNEVNNLPGGAGTQTSLTYYFPSETSEVCRKALERPDKQVGYFRHFFDHEKFRALAFALGVLGLHGAETDLCVLRQYSDHANLGQSAINAIRNLENRLKNT